MIPASFSPVIEPTSSELSPQIHNRRSFLKTTSIGVGAVAASSSISSAYLFRNKKPIVLKELPSAWVRAQGANLQNYARYVQSLRLKYITVDQVMKAHARSKGSTWNSLPPRSIWTNIADTLRVADRMSARIGAPVKNIASAYRSPAYNRRCPGAKSRSWHMQNHALDLQFSASPYTVARVARDLRSQGYFKGGVGRYSSFTHVDTRGNNVDW